MLTPRRFFAGLTLKPQGFTMVIAAFLPTFAIIAMFPVVAAIIAHFHDDPQAAIKVPAMVTAPGYAIALLAPFAGALVDRYGRRRLLLICTGFYGVVGAAPVLLESLDSIIASRLLLGVCEAGILTIVNTLIADYWDDAGRRNWLMLQGLLGPAVQPFLFLIVSAVAATRWNAGFLVYLVAVPIFIAMYAYMFEPVAPAKGSTDRVGSEGGFPYATALGIAAVTFASSIIYYVFIVNGSIAWKEIGLTDPMAVSKATFFPCMFILAGTMLFRAISKASNAIQIGMFMALFGIGLGGIGLARSVFECQLALTVQQTAAGMAVPVLIAWSQTKFGFAHRGRGMGIWSSAFFLGQAVSPVIFGTVAARVGSMQGAFVVAGAAALLGTVAAIGLNFRAKPRI